MGRGDGPLIQIIVQPPVPAVAVSSTAIVRSLFSTKLGQAFNLANNTFMVSFVVTPENKRSGASNLPHYGKMSRA